MILSLHSTYFLSFLQNQSVCSFAHAFFVVVFLSVFFPPFLKPLFNILRYYLFYRKILFQTEVQADARRSCDTWLGSRPRRLCLMPYASCSLPAWAV